MTRPRYTKRQKATAVIAATLTSQTSVAEATGIPQPTISRWVNDPAMHIFVSKTRDQLADEMGALAALAVHSIQEYVRAGRFEPRDLVTLMGVATEKSLLLSGDATSRSETRDITGTLSDAELIAAIREADRIANGEGTPEAAPVET